jgi:hypothetical protein
MCLSSLVVRNIAEPKSIVHDFMLNIGHVISIKIKFIKIFMLFYFIILLFNNYILNKI